VVRRRRVLSLEGLQPTLVQGVSTQPWIIVSRRMSDALSQARTQGGHKELSPAASQETAVASFTDSEPARASEERLLADHTSDAERGGASMDAGVSLDRVPAIALLFTPLASKYT
jgi:hypothetical protein